MNLGYFTMSLHPPGRDYVQTLKEDSDAVLLADELGFTEALVGEHVTDVAESVTDSAVVLASLAPVTKNITLGTGTVNLPNVHPAAIRPRSRCSTRSSRAFRLRHQPRRAAVRLGGVREPRPRSATDALVDQVVIAGTVNRVVEELLAFREEVGTLLYCGLDWVDSRLARRSMELMAESVMPAVNRAIG